MNFFEKLFLRDTARDQARNRIRSPARRNLKLRSRKSEYKKNSLEEIFRKKIGATHTVYCPDITFKGIGSVR